MSKTHKITKLKKRIAELERQLSRTPSFTYSRCEPIRIKRARKLSYHDVNTFGQQPAFVKMVLDALVRDLSESEDFSQCVQVSKHPVSDSPYDGLIVEAEISVLPIQPKMSF